MRYLKPLGGAAVAFGAAALLALAPAAAGSAAQAARERSVANQSSFSASQSELPGFDIRILPGSVIHLVSQTSKLPISIENNYPVEVRVQVHVAASNLDALIPAVVEVTVPANTTYVAQVPVKAIADGEVMLHSWLTTFSGLPLGGQVDQKLVINAELENSALGGFAVLVIGLGIVGVVRTRAKRRRKGNAEVTQ
jgi:hypothetical protein